MALTATNALISIQDGAGAAVNLANGATGQYTAGGTLTFALQNTSGIQRWDLIFQCPGLPALHQRVFNWTQGMANTFQVPMPGDPVNGPNPLNGIVVTSEVSDGSGGAVAYVTNYLTNWGGIDTGSQHTVRAVALTALQAYTNVGGVLTENSNGALGNQDGVTLAVGDLILVPPGTPLTNGANADAGIYQVTSLGGAGAKWVLTSAPDWPQGQVILPKTEVLVTEGTVYSGSTWVVTNTGKTNAIGATSFTFFPRQVSQSLTLVAGTVTVANVPVVSATRTNVVYNRTTANTTASTIIYATIGGITAGALGTATFNFQAAVAAGTINAADISTLTVTVINPV